jgi:hypothetical protein
MKQYDAQEVIDRIAAVAEAVGKQAGVGGMETAGAILSYLAEHPRDLEPFMNGGFFELPADMHMHGKLTWLGRDGRICTPEHARRAVIVSKLEKGAAA